MPNDFLNQATVEPIIVQKIALSEKLQLSSEICYLASNMLAARFISLQAEY